MSTSNPGQLRKAGARREIAPDLPIPTVPVALLVASQERTLTGTRRDDERVPRNFARIGQFAELAKLEILHAGHLMMFDDPGAVATAFSEVAKGGQ